ncbi:hypothetical protein OY671_008489, partial [Metschnikowia pulcherrima]
KWLDAASGSVARAADLATQAIGSVVGDSRDKIVFEFFFGRHVPEARPDNGLGWTSPREAAEIEPESGKSSSDRLYETNPELFASEPERPGHEPDHGIDR